MSTSHKGGSPAPQTDINGDAQATHQSRPTHPAGGSRGIKAAVCTAVIALVAATTWPSKQKDVREAETSCSKTTLVPNRAAPTPRKPSKSRMQGPRHLQKSLLLQAPHLQNCVSSQANMLRICSGLHIALANTLVKLTLFQVNNDFIRHVADIGMHEG